MPSFSNRISFSDPNDPLNIAMLSHIPPDETPQQRKARHELEAAAKKISDEIDERLRQERTELGRKKIVKILLLGQAESGKSTTLKNIQLLYAPASLRAETATWRAIIHLNLIKSMTRIMDMLCDTSPRKRDREDDEQPEEENSTLPPLINPEHEQLISRLQSLKEAENFIRMRISPPDDQNLVVANSHDFAVRSASGWKQSFLRMKGTRTSTAAYEAETTRILAACAPDMVRLWNDPTVRQVLRYCKARMEESSGFFLDDINRLTSPTYIPTDEDVLKARLPTVGVQEHKIELETGPERGHIWYIFDVGGSRSQRASWIPFFDNVNAIICLAPISAFDQALAENPKVNRLEDSLLIWKNICASKLLINVELILFLNKYDLLEQKLMAGIRVDKFVLSFAGQPNTVETVSKYFRDRFKHYHTTYGAKRRRFYAHFTSVTDYKTTSVIVASVRETILKANLTSANVL